MRRGLDSFAAWEQRLLDQRESVHVTARCAWCEWTLNGTVRETREAYAAHRTAEHPEVVLKPRRRRHRPHRQWASMTNVDDNIAAARQQGAATWARPL